MNSLAARRADQVPLAPCGGQGEGIAGGHGLRAWRLRVCGMVRGLVEAVQDCSKRHSVVMVENPYD